MRHLRGTGLHILADVPREIHERRIGLLSSFRKEVAIMSYINTRVAGTTFNGRQNMLAYVDKNTTNTRIALVREPNNSYDPNAVKVIAVVKKTDGTKNTVCLGYLPKAEAARIAPVMDSGKWIKINQWTVTGGYGTKKNYGARLVLTY